MKPQDRIKPVENAKRIELREVPRDVQQECCGCPACGCGCNGIAGKDGR